MLPQIGFSRSLQSVSFPRMTFRNRSGLILEGERTPRQCRRTRHTFMTSQGESHGPIDRRGDADAGRNQHFGSGVAIVAYLQGGIRTEEIEPVMRGANDTQRLAEAARPRGEHPRRRVRGKSTVASHLLEACNWFKRAQQHAAGKALLFA